VRSFGIAEPVGTIAARLGEGPRWDSKAGRLLWVDIEGERLHAGDRTIECGAMVGAVAPWAGDTVLVALADALAAVDVRSGSVRRLAEVPHGRPGMRCNDGACDAAGRFWIGTMALDEAPGVGALHRYDPDGALHTVLTGVTLSVLDFDVASGTVANRRPFAVIPESDGIPDGLALDDEGGIWVALYGGAQVRRFDPDGRVSGRVEVPVPRVTACCFAGSRMFVTAREGLFALDLPYLGPPARPFGGPPPTP
jgi:sugar lactone lactonase YvrE